MDLRLGINTVRNKIKNSRLISNFIYLSGLQAVNYILPLVTFPYLLRILQPELFGITVYAQTLIIYFLVFVDYGFNITATRRISIHKDDLGKVSEVFSSVITTKLILMIISLVVFGLMILLIPKFSQYWILYAFTAGVIVGQVFLPIWLFQGLQEMKYLMYFNAFTRIIFTVLILVVVKVPSDFIYVNLMSSFANIFIGFLSIAFVLKKFGLKFKIASRDSIQREFREGLVIFLSNISMQFYMSSSLIILGFFCSDTHVGNYSVAEKLILIIRQLHSVFSQVIYPHVCQLASTNGALNRFFKKSMLPFMMATLLLCISLFGFAEQIVVLLTKKNIPEIVVLIRMLSFVPIIVGLNIPSYQTLLAYDQKNTYSIIMISGAFLSLGLNFILVNIYGTYGSAMSVIITEIIIVLSLTIAVKRFYAKRNLLNKSE